jgi:16S rRNA (guanine527-N7)-methyltransferase
LPPEVATRLFVHYQELCRWNRLLSLVGPGTAGEVVERHYGESLAALPLAPAEGRLVDLGSGAGFPGWVLAAARPGLEVTLVESRRRKCDFLEAVSTKAALSCRCLNARVSRRLPEGFPEEIDLITVRAVKLLPRWVSLLEERLSPGGALLLWQGRDGGPLPAGLQEGRSLRLTFGSKGRIVEALRPGRGAHGEGA